MVIALGASANCNSYSTDQSACEQSKFNTYAGAAILALGLGAGIYMTVQGRRMRRGLESDAKENIRPSEVVINMAWNF